jgi:hypothetical protein
MAPRARAASCRTKIRGELGYGGGDDHHGDEEEDDDCGDNDNIPNRGTMLAYVLAILTCRMRLALPSPPSARSVGTRIRSARGGTSGWAAR